MGVRSTVSERAPTTPAHAQRLARSVARRDEHCAPIQGPNTACDRGGKYCYASRSPMSRATDGDFVAAMPSPGHKTPHAHGQNPCTLTGRGLERWWAKQGSNLRPL